MVKILSLTVFIFNNFCKHYGLKANQKFCYIHTQYEQPQYTYSQQAIDFIVVELTKDPEHILDNIKTKNKSTQGKGNSKHYCLLPFRNPAISFSS